MPVRLSRLVGVQVFAMIAVLLAAGAMLNATATETTALSSAKLSCICWCHPSSSCYLYYSATVTTSISIFLAIAHFDSDCSAIITIVMSILLAANIRNQAPAAAAVGRSRHVRD